MIIHHDILQGSPEWFALRLGVTGSECHKLFVANTDKPKFSLPKTLGAKPTKPQIKAFNKQKMVPTQLPFKPIPKFKLSQGKQARDYLAQVIEQLQGGFSFDEIEDFEKYESYEMKKGKLLEEEAKEWFTQGKYGWIDVGFIEHDSKMLAVSPDHVQFALGEDKIIAGLEVKCPQSKNGYITLRDCKNGQDLLEANSQYFWQVQECMYVCELEEWHFLSYVRDRRLKRNTFIVEADKEAFKMFDLIREKLQNELSK